MAVHQEAIVTPENIDAVRAVLEMKGASDSIRLTNSALKNSYDNREIFASIFLNRFTLRT